VPLRGLGPCRNIFGRTRPIRLFTAGLIGAYPVGGVVKDGNAYLAISEDGWTNYTAVLDKPTSDRLTGKYSCSVPFSETKSYPVEYVRTNP